MMATTMFADQHLSVEFADSGTGPTLVLVPGSCSTGAAWRPVMAALDGRFRCITTSLPGYGSTAERRNTADTSIARIAEAVEIVVDRAADAVHIVGHSFGGLAALAAVLRKRVSIASLVLLEPPAVTLLQHEQYASHDAAFKRMRNAYLSAHAAGDREAISIMIDYYGGAGTFASWPEKVRGYAIDTTAVNLLDWESAYGFDIPAASLGAVDVPVLVVRGALSHPAMHRITEILAERCPGARLATIAGATHFMISTHARDVAELIIGHVPQAGIVTR